MHAYNAASRSLAGLEVVVINMLVHDLLGNLRNLMQLLLFWGLNVDQSIIVEVGSWWTHNTQVMSCEDLFLLILEWRDARDLLFNLGRAALDLGLLRSRFNSRNLILSLNRNVKWILVAALLGFRNRLH